MSDRPDLEYDVEFYFILCTDDCPEDCMADHRGEE